MKKILLLLYTIVSISYSQIIYDVEPGTEGNQINLTLLNISEINQAEEVEVKLAKSSSFLFFTKKIETIELLEPKEETEVTFLFDITRNVSVNKKDTIEFMITNKNGLLMIKSFIFNYTGPKEFKLEQNFPNPFNPTTTIQYQIPEVGTSRHSGTVLLQLKVYDILGSEIVTLVNEEQEPGFYEVQFNGSTFPSGVYFYNLQVYPANGGASDFVMTKKMILVK